MKGAGAVTEAARIAKVDKDFSEGGVLKKEVLAMEQNYSATERGAEALFFTYLLGLGK